MKNKTLTPKRKYIRNDNLADQKIVIPEVTNTVNPIPADMQVAMEIQEAIKRLIDIMTPVQAIEYGDVLSELIYTNSKFKAKIKNFHNKGN